MIVSKKKYDFLLDRYEQAASRADLLERQLAELNGEMEKHGTPYKCILECREAAMAVPAAMNTHSWPAMQRITVPALTRTTRRSLSGMSPVSVRVKLTSCFLTRPARKYVPSVTDWRRHLWKTA